MSVTLLAIDVGNTRIKCALFVQGQMIEDIAFLKDDADRIIHWFDKSHYNETIVSSVADFRAEWNDIISKKGKIYFLNHELRMPIQLDYKSPETLGRDRISACCGAMHHFPHRNCLVVNAGSCITFDLLDNTGHFKGGNIAPGMQMRWKAMHEFTAKLPLVSAPDGSTPTILGQNTEGALQQGVLFGIKAEIESYFHELSTKYNELICVLSGGDSNFLAKTIKIKTFVRPFLVLEGLYAIWQWNQGNSLDKH